jgi:hypothetical protein
MHILAHPLWLTIVGLGFAGAVFLVALLIGPRWVNRDLFSVLFVASVVAVAIAVTIQRVAEYRAEQQKLSLSPARPLPEVLSPFTEPLAGPIPLLRAYSPMTRPPTGAAAPALHSNPYFDGKPGSRPGRQADFRQPGLVRSSREDLYAWRRPCGFRKAHR